jgi:hypothetical protein
MRKFIFCLPLLAIIWGCAAPKTCADKHSPASGFIQIFNGTNLDGWAGPLDCCAVRDGAMVWQPNKGGTIYTQAEFTNFIVRLEFKLPPGGNNGLAIRYPGSGDTAYVGMCECQVLDDNYEKKYGAKN